MIDGNPPLSTQDIERLARLQLDHLPTSLVSILGLGYSKAFYRYIARSREETLFLERNQEGVIVGVALLSEDMATFERRLLLHTPLVFAAIPRIAPLVRLLTKGRTGPAPETSPELVTLFTDTSARGLGLGAKLVDRLTARLREKNAPWMYVRTFDDPENPAVKFYTSRGFMPVCSLVARGTPFLLLKMQLSDE